MVKAKTKLKPTGKARIREVRAAEPVQKGAIPTVENGRIQLLGPEKEAKQRIEDLVVGGRAQATEQAAAAGWKMWEVFTGVKGREPYLTGATREEINRDEDLVLTYMSHLTAGMGWGADTVGQKLGVIAREHVIRGLGDPLQRMDRIRMALQKLKREQGAPEKKLQPDPRRLPRRRNLVRSGA